MRAKMVSGGNSFDGTRAPFSLSCWLLFLWGSCLPGCASLPYQYGQFQGERCVSADDVNIEYGKPQKCLDRLAWYTGIWSRILPLNAHVNRHALSEETRLKLVAYLEENELTDVLIRVNQYDPRGEWRRLRENHHIGVGWRYSAGVLSLMHYTLLPGRVFGGDTYNAYTNTLYINSDVPAVVIHEAAYAKDIHARRLPGTYATLNELPVICLWRHTNGINDVLGYTQTTGDWNVERETYRVVYPQMGARSVVLAGQFLPLWDGLLISVAGAVVGHATGQVVIHQRVKQRHELGLDEEPENTKGVKALTEQDDEAEPEDVTEVGRISLTSHLANESR